MRQVFFLRTEKLPLRDWESRLRGGDLLIFRRWGTFATILYYFFRHIFIHKHLDKL
jgi:hypothetical protein